MTPNVWKDCAMWLTNCGVLRPDHKTHSPDASLSDLAYTLRDGVLLCNLLNNLENGCLDFKDVNQKPQMAQVGRLLAIFISHHYLGYHPCSSSSHHDEAH